MLSCFIHAAAWREQHGSGEQSVRRCSSESGHNEEYPCRGVVTVYRGIIHRIFVKRFNVQESVLFALIFNHGSVKHGVIASHNRRARVRSEIPAATDHNRKYTSPIVCWHPAQVG